MTIKFQVISLFALKKTHLFVLSFPHCAPMVKMAKIPSMEHWGYMQCLP